MQRSAGTSKLCLDGSAAQDSRQIVVGCTVGRRISGVYDLRYLRIIAELRVDFYNANRDYLESRILDS